MTTTEKTLEQKYGTEVGTATKDGAAFKVFDNGSLVTIVDKAGQKVTHSDTREGLAAAGYVLEVKELPAPPSEEEYEAKIDALQEERDALVLEVAELKGKIEAQAETIGKQAARITELEADIEAATAPKEKAAA